MHDGERIVRQCFVVRLHGDVVPDGDGGEKDDQRDQRAEPQHQLLSDSPVGEPLHHSSDSFFSIRYLTALNELGRTERTDDMTFIVHFETCWLRAQCTVIGAVTRSTETNAISWSLTVARPLRHSAASEPPISGTGRISSSGTVTMSDTASTSMPIMRASIATMTTTWAFVGSLWPRPKRARRSRIGTMVPRRLMTPITNSGVFG